MDKKWQEWYTSTLRPLLEYSSQEEPSPQLKTLLARDPTQVDLALLAADTDRTQEYVFESAKLPEIRGGSELLRVLNEEELPKVIIKVGLPPECVIYAGGGSFLALVPASEAVQIASQIEKIYPSETKVATITCVTHRVNAIEVMSGYQPFLTYEDLLQHMDYLSDNERKRITHYYTKGQGGQIKEQVYKQKKVFGELVFAISVLLRQRKQEKFYRPFFEAIPFAQRCQSCQTRPADAFDNDPSGRWARCPVCRLKAQRGRRQTQQGGRFYWFNEFERFMEKELDLAKRYYTDVSATQNIDIPYELTQIGAACLGRSGYVGFIWADGDAMGHFFQQQDTPQSFRQASQVINQATRRAVMQALAENLKATAVTSNEGGADKYPVHPFEIITIGGDDVLLIVPGHAALPIASRISQLFEQNAPLRADGKSLTMSAGVVIASDHNPIRFLRDLSGELKQIAKKRAKETKTGAIDFHILKSQAMLGRDIAQTRKQSPYFVEAGGDKLSLLHRPYSIAEVCVLLRTLRYFVANNFPKTQLHALARTLPQGRHASTLFYMYQKARSTDAIKETLSQMESLWDLRPNLDPSPWIRARQGASIDYYTMLWDLAELYDFVPTSNNGQTAELWTELLDKEVGDAN